uniref:Uncharacterized protein n=1 Tax=Acrobeloides nanus TaxID=290746 RepID=A0A914CHZ8_9BILA
MAPMVMLISFLISICLCSTNADVSKCYLSIQPSDAYQGGNTCDPGTKYCLTASCSGVTGYVRGCDGNSLFPSVCSSKGCSSTSNPFIVGYGEAWGCTGNSVDICCCDQDDCNSGNALAIHLGIIVFSLIFYVYRY